MAAHDAAATPPSAGPARAGDQAGAVRRPNDSAHHGATRIGGTLDRVGMGGIEVPVRLRDPSTGAALLAPARADAWVSLDDPEARGIHMSRLYLALQAILAEEDLGFAALSRVVASFLGSHVGLGARAGVRVRFDHLVKRPALVSANAAWRAYPVWLGAESAQGRMRLTLGAEVLYSSTCPCSTALSRQLAAERLREEFAGRGPLAVEDVAAWLQSEHGLPALPHSQRSRAVVEIALADEQRAPAAVELIDLAERALATPVQAAVKREDEQEFARRNAENLMFCEDAARRLKAALDGDRRFADWRVEVAHLESLHPHDAVAAVAKGLPDGFRA